MHISSHARPTMPTSGATAYMNLMNEQARNGQQRDVEESALLRDLIFVFQGINGKMIKFEEESGTYVIDPSINITRSTRGLVSRLTELGLLYRKVNAYVQETLKLQKQETVGLVGQVNITHLVNLETIVA
ncbi:hypothetical protein BGX21_003319 [Mortierella sp. AD011]|nr:hypothetical protein BGX20_010917 [Mortierella sp. AD010]KAF9403503.1 hypothetical protein BGX21_003319 [Mortierella sp. AD011]